MAVGEPAHRAPTMIASYTGSSLEADRRISTPSDTAKIRRQKGKVLGESSCKGTVMLVGGGGDRDALETLMPLVHAELRGAARRRMAIERRRVARLFSRFTYRQKRAATQLWRRKRNIPSRASGQK